MSSYRLMSIDISTDGTVSYCVPQETQDFLSELHEDITPIAAVGPYRSGKSWMLGYLSKQPAAFNTSNGSQACTRGIHINTKPLLHQKLLFMDTEGLGAPGSNVEIDSKILACAILFAAKVYFFVVGKIDTKLLDSLQCAIGTANWLKDAANQNCFEFQKPQLVVVIKDLTLQLQDKQGNAITPNDYFQNCLEDYCIANNSELKQAIQSLFSNVVCMTTTIPCAEQDMKEMKNLNAKFISDIAAVASNAYNKTQIKCIAENTNMNGPILLQMARQLCQALSQPGAPRLLGVWQAAMEQAALEKRHRIMQTLHAKLQANSANTTQLTLNVMSTKDLLQTVCSLIAQYPQTWKHNEISQLLQALSADIYEFQQAQLDGYLKLLSHENVSQWCIQHLPQPVSDQLVSCIKEAQTTQKENETLRQELQEKTDAYNALDEQIMTLINDPPSEPNSVALQEKLDEVQRNYEQAQSYADDIMLTHTTFQSEIKEQVAKITERNKQLTAELNSAQQSLETGARTIDDLTNQLTTQNATIKQLTTAANDYARKRKIDDIQSKAQYDRVVKNATYIEQRYKEIQEKLDTSNEKCRELQMKLMRRQCETFFK